MESYKYPLFWKCYHVRYPVFLLGPASSPDVDKIEIKSRDISLRNVAPYYIIISYLEHFKYVNNATLESNRFTADTRSTFFNSIHNRGAVRRTAYGIN